MAWEEFRNFTSSNLAPPLRYESSTLVLEVHFQNGGIYHYYDVPNTIWEAFQRAPSQGKYLAEHIKGHYRYSRV